MNHPGCRDAGSGALTGGQALEGSSHRFPPGSGQGGEGITAPLPAGPFSHGQGRHCGAVEIAQAEAAPEQFGPVESLEKGIRRVRCGGQAEGGVFTAQLRLARA